jgi:hypothetical protein
VGIISLRAFAGDSRMYSQSKVWHPRSAETRYQRLIRPAPVKYDVQTLAPATPLSKTAAGIRKAKLKTRRSSNSQQQEKTRASTEPRKSASSLSTAAGRDMAEYSAVDIGADELVADSGVGYTTPTHIHLEEHTTDSTPLRNLSMVEETPRSTSLPPITSLLSRTQGFLSTPPSNMVKEYSSMFHHNTTSSSRIEDISITPNPVDVSSNRCHAQTHVRTQYIMVKRDERWRPSGGIMH